MNVLNCSKTSAHQLLLKRPRVCTKFPDFSQPSSTLFTNASSYVLTGVNPILLANWGAFAPVTKVASVLRGGTLPPLIMDMAWEG